VRKLSSTANRRSRSAQPLLRGSQAAVAGHQHGGAAHGPPAGGAAPRSRSALADLIDALIRWCSSTPSRHSSRRDAVGGYYALSLTPVDAIPDIGEKQVIVVTEWAGRSPQDVDDQVTYPLTTSLTGTPGVKTIRSMSGFGFAMVFVIFKDEVDYYWARSRVIERMNVAQQRLPAAVTPVIGPDATALGQVFWYTVEAEGFDLAELRSVQDWYLRYQLNSVEGVSEVASIGGFVKQYQIDVHPDKLRAHRVTLMDVYEAVRKSNIDVGAKVLEKNAIEFFVRGVGFIKAVDDLKVVVRQEQGTPIQVKHVATVSLGPESSGWTGGGKRWAAWC
jgi:Cu(I)/Ag(I) efflux system membrane protein CusA/SilA